MLIIINQRRNHIVSSRNGVHVPREMEVDILHGKHLGKASSCCAALHAETDTQRRFTKRNSRFFTYLVECHRKPNSNGGFTITGLCRGNRCNQDELALLKTVLVDKVDGQFCYMLAVRYQSIF